MSDTRESRHLPPAVFVDILESTPLDWSWKRHLGSCGQCRQELEELRAALSWAQSDRDEGSPVEPVASVTAPLSSSLSRRKYWIASAAAVVLAGLFLYRGSHLETTPPVVAIEPQEILPPIEQDEEFHWLVVLTDSMDLDSSLDPDSPFSELVPAADELTIEQREELLDRLAEEMRASS